MSCHRTFLSLLGAFALLFFVVACEPETSNPPAGCGPSNCGGCCDVTGQCKTTAANDACGLNGAACQTCGSTQTCQSGVCQLSGPACSAQNCGGCCSGDTCMPGTDKTTCGRDGLSCKVCSGAENCTAGICGQICNATTCPAGCCHNGQCIGAGQQNVQTCGTGGQACKACGNGEECVAQQCKTTSCGPGSCNGCCDAAGNCKTGSADGACGAGGAQCQICDTAKSQTCSSGSCQTVSTTCNPTTCPAGCCDDKGTCVPGNAATNCGTKGQACAQCGSNLQCVGQKCSCTSTSCPGCCDGDTCKAGSDVNACGASGAACAKCTGTDKCVTGKCQTDCSFLTCAGCCNGTTCVDPTNVSNCGIYGSACGQCSAGDVCENGTCNDKTKCSASTCPTGCCKNGTCQVGTFDDACGEKGDVCELCGPHLYCGTDPFWNSRECLANNSSTWDVIVSKVKLNPNPSSPWDTFIENPPPDVFVEITVAGKTGKTSIKNNEFNPIFDDFVLTASASDLGTEIKYKILDDDFFGSDTIGDCTSKIFPRELKQGFITLTGCHGDPQNKDVLEILFKFVVKSK